ncbi:M14/M99 family metallopeptidase [Deltaproteobacteria bacterium OttesenSCG-928-M10]|nr:M14/M99 family metallopeptidase [Deltaproteobacteria bacterium OttesenSCG-928-M10]
MMPKIYTGLLAFLLIFTAAAFTAAADPSEPRPRDRQHLIFWAGTPQEIEVYKIYGRREGPTVMILGGIQGDEPGGFMSADLYADLALKRGNLIVVPRANFKSIIKNNRGPDGDMNRKFQGDLSRDPDQATVEIIKDLMAESDLLLNLHDGSGYYRPTWESELANPNRYGQCIIADADVFTHPETGRVIPLAEYAEEVVRRVNEDISEPLYKFHFFNTKTGDSDSRHKEQRGSATWFALTEIGIPAYGVETSKLLPDLEMKIHQHNLAVNAFLDIFGVEVEQPRITLDPPVLGYVVISVNDELPIAVADGQTLQVAKGDTIEVVHVGANYDRGLSVDVKGLGGLNDIRSPLKIEKPTSIVVQKDHLKIGRINVELLPADYAGQSPRLIGQSKLKPPRTGTPVPPEAVAQARAAVTRDGGSALLAPQAVSAGSSVTPEGPADSSVSSATTSVGGKLIETLPITETIPARPGSGKVTGFLIEVDGQPVELAPGQQFEVLSGAKVKMVDLQSDGPLPKGVTMNLKGFVPKQKQARNDGEDRGFTADTSRDMMAAFSVRQRGQVYELNAERGKDILASCAIKIVQPKLESVTFNIGEKTHTLKLGGRLGIPAGTKVTVTEIRLAGGLTLNRPRFTLGGRAFPPDLPQTLTMPSIAVNLAVFNGEALAGKVMWFPR